jgi:hypothetical protein
MVRSMRAGIKPPPPMAMMTSGCETSQARVTRSCSHGQRASLATPGGGAGADTLNSLTLGASDDTAS